MTIRRIVATLLLVVAGSGRGWADVRLPGLVSDHMVIQGGVPARVFGWADPGEGVTVGFRGQTVSTATDALGYFQSLEHLLRYCARPPSPLRGSP